MKKFKAYKCDCGQVTINKIGYCLKCRLKSPNHSILIEDIGEVFSHTTVHISDKSLELSTPYTVAVIVFANNLRLLGRLEESENQLISIGDFVKFTGHVQNSPIFRRIEQQTI